MDEGGSRKEDNVVCVGTLECMEGSRGRGSQAMMACVVRDEGKGRW